MKIETTIIMLTSDAGTRPLRSLVDPVLAQRTLELFRAMHREWRADPFILPHPIDPTIEAHEDVRFHSTVVPHNPHVRIEETEDD